MPQSCVAFGCNNRGSIDGITYHSFPKNEEARRLWVNAVKRKDWAPTKHSRICSMHFRESDMDIKNRIHIKEGAVPSIFPAFNQVNDRRPLKRHINITQSPTKKLKIELNKTKTTLIKKNTKIKLLQQSKRRLDKKITKLGDILDVLRKKMFINEEYCYLLNTISKTSKCLIKRAIEKTNNPTLKKTYEQRLKTFSITLHYLSPKAYSFVRKTFDCALPHPRTLRRWYSSINAEPGFSKEVLRALKDYSNISNKIPICSLMLDCMSIRKHLEWDGNRFHGTINVGGDLPTDDSAPLATEALVFYLVFINAPWKIPLGHFFVAGITGDQLSGLVKQCLNLLYDNNINVASLTCDGTACNIAMVNDLGCCINPKNIISTFPHPSTNEAIHFFLDASHMIKLIRNTLGDCKVLFNLNGDRVEWRFIELLHQLQIKEGLHLGNKLTSTHINYVKQKMKVKLAVQVLSRSVADALEYLFLNKVPGFNECYPTVEFLRYFDKLFDILNSRSIRAKYEKQALHPKNFEMHAKFLQQVKIYISQLKDSSGVPIMCSRRKTGFIGLTVCIESTLLMYEKYVKGENKPLQFLPLYKMSQDHLERLFGYIRARGGHNNNPTCKQFTGSFKRILLHKELEETNTGNTLVLNKSLIFTLNTKREIDDINSSTSGWRAPIESLSVTTNKEEVDDVEEEFFFTILETTSDVACNILEYIAGYLVRSVTPKIACEPCLELLVSNEHYDTKSLISRKNRGGLIKPSEGVVKICLICGAVLKECINAGQATTTKNIVNILINKVLRRTIGVNIFQDEHFFDQEPEQNHMILLIKALSRKFFNIRLHHHSKSINNSLHKQRIRNHLCKVITFLGQ